MSEQRHDTINADFLRTWADRAYDARKRNASDK